MSPSGGKDCVILKYTRPRTAITWRCLLKCTSRRQKAPVSVLIVAPTILAAECLEKAFSTRTFAATALAGNSANVSAELLRSKFDVALISETLEDGPRAGFEILLQLRRRGRRAKVVVLLNPMTGDSAVVALALGARGVLNRAAPPKTLRQCVRTVHAGQFWVGNAEIEKVMRFLRTS